MSGVGSAAWGEGILSVLIIWEPGPGGDTGDNKGGRNGGVGRWGKTRQLRRRKY